MLIKEHDSVVLPRPLPEHGLQIGDVGAVVFVHRKSAAYEVEFVASDGKTAGVVTLTQEYIRRPREDERAGLTPFNPAR